MSHLLLRLLKFWPYWIHKKLSSLPEAYTLILLLFYSLPWNPVHVYKHPFDVQYSIILKRGG